MYCEGKDSRVNPVRRTLQVEEDFPRNSSRHEKKSVHEKSMSRKETGNDIVIGSKNYSSYRSPPSSRQAIKEPSAEHSGSMKMWSGKRKHDSFSVITRDSSKSRSPRENAPGFRSEDMVTAKKKKVGKKDKDYEKQEKVVDEAEPVILLSSEETLRIKLAKHQAKRKEQRKKRKLKEQAKRKLENSNSTGDRG